MYDGQCISRWVHLPRQMLPNERQIVPLVGVIRIVTLVLKIRDPFLSPQRMNGRHFKLAHILYISGTNQEKRNCFTGK